MASVDAVLMIAFGGPTTPAEVLPFLDIVSRGRRIPPERLDEVAHHYARMPGGASPINALTRAQADALAGHLASDGLALPVYVGQRNWHPFFRETLREMAGKRHRRAVGVIMSALRTEASWERYMADVAAACAETPGAPTIVFAPPFGTHPGFVAAVAARARRALAEVPVRWRAAVPLVFTAHSVPVAMAERSPYVEDMTAACEAVVAALDHTRWSIAWQSRSGSPRDPWLEPDVTDVVRRLAADGERHAVLVPLGFLCDHVEVLYDLDVEARQIADAVDLTLYRAGTVSDHPEFIAALADVVTQEAS